ncbi:MAG TPA: hypothetical protein VFN57_18630 [Thermomicrobiaceae bacterium]|nr:hypothetical protein [Thermomicrobiaceae bacterium]
MTAPGLPLSTPAPAAEPGEILPITRVALFVLLGLGVANGVFLYLTPARAATGYAWSIKPAINAAFLGAGYLSGAFSAAVTLLAVRRWRAVRTMVWPLIAFGTLMLIATVVHRDRFRWGYPLTWVWTAVYVAVPLGTAGLWLLQRRAEPADTEPGGRPPFAAEAAVTGAVLALVGVAIPLTPTAAIAHWPWAITPLLARAFGGWYILAGGILLVTALTARSAAETAVPSLTVACWSLLIIVLPLVHGEGVRTATMSFRAWVALHALALLVSAAVAARSLRRLRRATTTS